MSNMLLSKDTKKYLHWIKRLRLENEFISNPSPFTPSELCNDILNKLSLNKDQEIGVMYTLEFAAMLKERGMNNITVLTDEFCEHTEWMAMEIMGCGYQTIKEIENMGKKFDVVIGNPPYQKDNGRDASAGHATSTDIYDDFFTRSLALINKDGMTSMIIPDKWISIKSTPFKQFIFNSGKIKEIELYYDKWFNAAIETCNVIYDSNHNGCTKFIDMNQKEIDIDLSTRDFLPRKIDDIEYIKLFNGPSYLNSRYIKGIIARNKIIDDDNGIDIIEYVGRANEPFNLRKISTNLTNVGYGDHKIALPTTGSFGHLGNNIKICEPDQTGSSSVTFLTTGSKIESENLIKYLQTAPIKKLVKGIKRSVTNTKVLFSYIPDVDLSIEWDDQKVYDHFNFTDEMIEYAKG